MAFEEGSNSELFIGEFSSFVETTVLKFFTKNAIYLPNFVTLRYYTLFKL